MKYNAYTQTLCEQVDVHCHLLNQLSDKTTPLTQLERTAAERSLQILAETVIGSSKHLNRKLQLPTRSDAYQTLIQIAETCGLSTDTLLQLRGAIGMRNAIVHDYLNLDWDRLSAVIKEKKYLLLADITRKICQLLK